MKQGLCLGLPSLNESSCGHDATVYVGLPIMSPTAHMAVSISWGRSLGGVHVIRALLTVWRPYKGPDFGKLPYQSFGSQVPHRALHGPGIQRSRNRNNNITLNMIIYHCEYMQLCSCIFIYIYNTHICIRAYMVALKGLSKNASTGILVLERRHLSEGIPQKRGGGAQANAWISPPKAVFTSTPQPPFKNSQIPSKPPIETIRPLMEVHCGV